MFGAFLCHISFQNLNELSYKIRGAIFSYGGLMLDLGFRMDILVLNEIILEVKSVETLHDIHKKQLLTYLKLANKKLGLLVNFSVSSLKSKESIIRIIN